MDWEAFEFGDTSNNYSIDISEEEVRVFGCDCSEVMEDEVVVKVHAVLDEYLKFKGLK